MICKLDTEIDTLGVQHNNSSDKSEKSISSYYKYLWDHFIF